MCRRIKFGKINMFIHFMLHFIYASFVDLSLKISNLNFKMKSRKYIINSVLFNLLFIQSYNNNNHQIRL